MKVSKKDIFGFLFFLVIWIIPISYSGILNKDMPGFPRTFCYLQRIAMLFTHSIESWPIYYMQVKPQNTDQWMTLKEEDFFRLKPFGYRTRLLAILYESKDGLGYKRGNERATARYRELAEWIAGRYSQLNPEQSKIDKVRYVVTFYYSKQGKNIKGRWQRPALSAFSKNQRLILFTHTIN